MRPVAVSDEAPMALMRALNTRSGSAVTLRNSAVHALEAVRGTLALLGTNDLSLPPLNLLGAIGLPQTVVAILLELLHLLRQRAVGTRARAIPPTVAVGT